MKPGFRLDISAYKVQLFLPKPLHPKPQTLKPCTLNPQTKPLQVKTAMELEKAKAVTLQLEREVEALEVEPRSYVFL